MYFKSKLSLNSSNLFSIEIEFLIASFSFKFLKSIEYSDNFTILNISHKINGKFNISIKNTDSFIGRINDLKMKLIFENGDIRVQSGSAILPHKSKNRATRPTANGASSSAVAYVWAAIVQQQRLAV